MTAIRYASCKYQDKGKGSKGQGAFITVKELEGEKMMPDVTTYRPVSGKGQGNAGSTVEMVGETQSMLCPFIQKPFDECYCTSTSSLYAEATIYFCGGHFRACEIYVKNVKGRDNQG